MPTTSASLPPAPWREWLMVVGVSLVLITGITWPLVPHMATLGRLDSGDGKFSIWNVGWVAHALLTHPTQLLNANIYSPHPGALAYSEMNLVAGVLGLPAFLVTGNALAAHNFAVALALLLSMVCTWWLVRTLTGSSGAGVVSATLFTFCSYMQGHTAHVQLLMTFVIPLVMLAFHRLREAPTVARAIALGVALAVAGLACGYYGIYGGIFLGFAAVIFARRSGRYWLALGGAAMVAAALVTPVLVPYLHARDITGLTVDRTVPGLQISADAQDYIASPTLLERSVVGSYEPEIPHEFLSPGFVLAGLVILAVATLWRPGAPNRSAAAGRATVLSYLGLAGIAIWASLGPSAGLYAVLMQTVPGISLLRAPCRFGPEAIFALAVVGGFGATVLVRGRVWALVALIAICGVDRYADWSLYPDPIPQAYRVLATLPAGVVVDYPFPYMGNGLFQHTRAMYYSTADWMPRVNGYSDLIPQDFFDIAAPLNEFPDLPTFSLLHRYNVRYVVWRLENFKRDPAAMAVLTNRLARAAAYIRPIYKDDVAWLYEIVRWPAGSSVP